MDWQVGREPGYGGSTNVFINKSSVTWISSANTQQQEEQISFTQVIAWDTDRANCLTCTIFQKKKKILTPSL